MIKIIQSQQQESKKSPEIQAYPAKFHNIRPLSEELVQNPLKHFNVYKYSEKKVLNYLLKLGNDYDTIIQCQKKRGHILGLARETVNRIEKKFQRHGLIEIQNIKKEDGFNEASHIKINPWFYLPHVSKKLSTLFVSLSFFYISSLFSLCYVTPISSRYIYKNYRCYRSSINAHAREGKPAVHGKWSQDSNEYFQKEKERRRKREQEVQEVFEEKYAYLESNTHKFPLTVNGILKMCIFPLEAIKHAMSMARYALLGDNPFSCLFNFARAYCDERSIKWDMADYLHLRDEFQCTDSDPLLDSVQLREMRISLEQEQKAANAAIESIKGRVLAHKHDQPKQVQEKLTNFPWEPEQPKDYNALRRAKCLSLGIDPTGMGFQEMYYALQDYVANKKG